MTKRSKNDSIRANRDIAAARVRVIDENGENLGVLSLDDAIRRAESVGLDLVEISSSSEGVVCRVMDFGKHKYSLQKKKSEARKNQKQVVVKEVKLRPNIEEHDYQVKFRSIHKFLSEGDRVRVTLRFRGREIAYQQLGLALLKRVQDELGSLAKVEHAPAFEGKQVIMVLGPQSS